MRSRVAVDPVTAAGGALGLAVLEELYWRRQGAPAGAGWLIAGAAATVVLSAIVASVWARWLPRTLALGLGLAVPAAPPCLALVNDCGSSGRWVALPVGAALSVLTGFGLAWLLSRRYGKSVLALTAAVTTIALLGGRAAGGGSRGTGNIRPNVVLIVLDTTRRDHLSLYGYPRPTSPSLDAFARECEVYEDAWSVAAWTPASHASILTGLLPAEHGVDGVASPPFTTSAPTLTRVLKQAGYGTAAFLANPILDERGWRRDFDAFQPPWSRGRHSLVRLVSRLYRDSSRWNPWNERSWTPRVFAQARSWWSAHRERPRFLFLNLVDPHRPYEPPPEYYRQFLGDVDPHAAMAVSQDPRDYRLHPGASADVRRILSGLYDGEVASMDHELGLFLAWLRDTGDLDRTVVVVTADHGERLGERGLVGHDLDVDQYLLRVPLIVRYPPRVRAGHVTRRVQLDGIAGYVLALADIEAPQVMARRALNRQDRRIVVAQYQEPRWFLERLHEGDPAFRTEPWHGDWSFVSDGRLAYLLRQVQGGPRDGRLVDLVQDPEWSREDLAPLQPDAARRLRSIAERLPRFGLVSPGEIDAEQVERLQSLGYVN